MRRRTGRSACCLMIPTAFWHSVTDGRRPSTRGQLGRRAAAAMSVLLCGTLAVCGAWNSSDRWQFWRLEAEAPLDGSAVNVDVACVEIADGHDDGAAGVSVGCEA